MLCTIATLTDEDCLTSRFLLAYYDTVNSLLAGIRERL
jgi:hypothetical protein